MLKLTKLFQSINYFYKLASDTISGDNNSADPEDLDEEELQNDSNDSESYNNLINLAQEFSRKNPEAAAELRLAAALYKKSIDLNDGFRVVINTIDNIIKEYFPEDDEENDDAADVLYEIYRDLVEKEEQQQKNIANGKIPKPNANNTNLAFKEVKNKFNESDLKNEIRNNLNSGIGGGNTNEENSQSQFQGLPNDSIPDETGGLSEIEDLVQHEAHKEKENIKFDMSGGANKETGNRGYSTTSKSNRGPAYSFENKKIRYLDTLKHTKNEYEKPYIKKLIDVLDLLIVNAKKAYTINLKLDAAPGDEEYINELKPFKKEFEELNTIKTALELKIRNIDLLVRNDKLLTELPSAKNLAQKRILDQEIALNENLRSRHLNRGLETSLRKQLIKDLKKGSFTEDQYNAKLQEIDAAAAGKKSLQEYEKNRTDNKQKLKETGLKSDLPLHARIKGMYTLLQEKLGTRKKELKKATAKSVKIEEHTQFFQKYIDELTQARAEEAKASPQDKPAKEMAVKMILKKLQDKDNKELMAIKEEIALSMPAVQEFIENSGKKFYDLRDFFKSMDNNGWLKNSPSDLDPQVKALIIESIEYGKQISEQYKNAKYNGPVSDVASSIINSLEQWINS